MVRNHFVWLTVLLVHILSAIAPLPSNNAERCVQECRNKPKFLNCEGSNLTRVPSSNECKLVFSLNLDNNQIYLETGDFTSFPGLNDVLSLNGNTIKIIPPFAFQNLSELKRLYLNRNNVTKLSRHAFGGLTSLKRLSLNHNKLAVIEYEMFENLTSAEVVLLESNVIENVTARSFRDLRDLQKLYLRRNRISELLNYTFSGLITLEELDLSNNHIDFMESNAFEGLVKLEKLNLSCNAIISVFAVHDLRLTVLDLSFNEVIKLNEDLNRRLQSQYQFAINVSNNPLSCNCSVKPLYDWYTGNRASPGDDIARCGEPSNTPLTDISILDICSKTMVTASHPLRTTVAIDSKGDFVRFDVDKKSESSWLLSVVCVVLGLLGLVLALAMTSISYRKCKRPAPNADHQMVPLETVDATTDPPPVINQQSGETMVSGAPALPPRRRLPQLPPEDHWRSPNAPHHSPSRHHTFRQRLSSLVYARDYLTRVIRTNDHQSSPTDVHIITTPCSPSAAGPSQQGLQHRVPNLSNHTIHHNYSNETGGVRDHVHHGCQLRTANALCPSFAMSSSRTYLSIHGTDSVTPTLRPPRKPHSQASLNDPTQCDQLMADLAPDKPEYGLKLGRNGQVQLISIEEIIQGRGWDDSCPRPESVLYAAL